MEGFDIVFGRRTDKPVSRIRKGIATMYFRALRVFTRNPLDAQYGTFSIISRRVAHSFLQLRDQDRHYLMVLNWLGYEAASVDYEPAARYAGESSYSLGKLIEHALDGLFFQTTVLLRWIVYLGFTIATAGGCLAIYLGIARATGRIYPGWTSIIVVILLMCGFIILSTGITGLYIGKLFEQSRGRPLFVVDRVVEHAAAPDGERTRETQPERMGW